MRMQAKELTLKSTYAAKTSISHIDMKDACTDLTPKSFYLLNMLYYRHIKGIDLKDSRACCLIGYGSGVYSDCKWELKHKGYIHIIQTYGNKYLWCIGKASIAKNKRRWKMKSDKTYIDEAKSFYEDIETI